MNTITFADVAHPELSFDGDRQSHRLILRLIETPWFQRLRDISQTANTRLVYMFSEHSRFGHSIGVAYLAGQIMDKLVAHGQDDVEPLRTAVTAAALLHDIGHLAPGSHTAFKCWFPHQHDGHERIGERIIQGDPDILEILEATEPGLAEMVCKVLGESAEIPPWSWEIISGGGWNVDRGNWCIVDSTLAGVSYGKYNISALTESIALTPDRHLALRENRLDAMLHFAVSRHAMYRQVYQHRVLLSADTLNVAIVRRARDLGPKALPFCDKTMEAALLANSPEDLTLPQIFRIREPWWRYHLMRWAEGEDLVLRDLSERLLNRRLFKTIRIHEGEDIKALTEQVEFILAELDMSPRYYLHHISTTDMHAGDAQQSMLVRRENGEIVPLLGSDPLYGAMASTPRKEWLVMPQEAKIGLGRVR